MRRSALYIIAVLFLASACNKVMMDPQRVGSISLALSSDTEVEVSTKADAVDCSNFLVDIYGTTYIGQDYASEQYRYSQMPEQIVIPYGTYNVSAQSCTSEAAQTGLGQVWYYGVSDQVEVMSQTPSVVTVNCQMVNGKFTMTVDESFLEDFTEVEIEISAGRSVKITDVQANVPTDVYFNTPAEGVQLVYTVSGKLRSTGVQLKYSNATSPITLLPAKWAKVTIRSNHNGLIGPEISVDGEMGDDSFTEVVDPFGGVEMTDGSLNLPTICVDTAIDDATVIECELEVI